MNHNLSAVVISFNEETHIEKCLTSLRKIADEIIVVDSFSTDSTPQICKRLNVKFIQHTYQGQIEQKLFALRKTSNTMIISLDADEELDSHLIENIKAEKALGFPENGYIFRRKAYYCGKWIRFGNWGFEKKLRLWNKNKADWKGTNPHDKVMMKDTYSARELDGHISHFTFSNRKEHENQVKNYAHISAIAQESYSPGLATLRSILSPLLYFLQSYLLRAGFLDGSLGWQVATLTMKEKFLKYNMIANRALSKNHL